MDSTGTTFKSVEGADESHPQGHAIVQCSLCGF